MESKDDQSKKNTSGRGKSLKKNKSEKSSTRISASMYAQNKGTVGRLKLWLDKTYGKELRSQIEWEKEFEEKQLM